MPHIAYAKTLQQSTNDVSKIRKPAAFPAAEPGEEKEAYVTSLAADSPLEYLTILGLDFPKRVFPVAASLLENQGKQFDSGVVVRELTKKQVSALQDRAKEVEVRIPAAENRAASTTTADKLILIVPVKQYQTVPQPASEPVAESVEPVETFQDTLYKEQRKRK